MYLLDTDHLTVFDRGGLSAQILLTKMSQIDPDEIATTIISYEEQTRGWLSDRKGVWNENGYAKIKVQITFCNVTGQG